MEKHEIITKNGCISTGAALYPPYSTYNEATKQFEGVCAVVYDLIMKKLGYCYSISKTPDGYFGNIMPNGSWTGVVGMMQREEIEVVLCPIARNYQRSQVMDFSEVMDFIDFAIAYPRPTIVPNYLGFVMPFSKETWTAILGTVILITMLTLIGQKFASRFKQIELKSKWRLEENFTLSLGWVYKALLYQNFREDLQGNGGRILAVFWMLVALCLGVVYKCNLKALLIVPKVLVPFNTLEELVNQNDIKFSFLNNSMIHSTFLPAFMDNPNSVFGKGWARKSKLYNSPTEFGDCVLKHKMACIEASLYVTLVMADDFSKTGKCRLATASERFARSDVTYGFKKGSKLQELINRQILRMRETGILHRLVHNDEGNATYCNVAPGKELKSQLRAFVVKDFIGIISILFAGWFMATLVFVLELATKNGKSCKTSVSGSSDMAIRIKMNQEEREE